MTALLFKSALSLPGLSRDQSAEGGRLIADTNPEAFETAQRRGGMFQVRRRDHALQAFGMPPVHRREPIAQCAALLG